MNKRCLDKHCGFYAFEYNFRMDLNKIYIVLTHPDEPRNIGSACRAMANSDITHLRIVGKKQDYDAEKVHVLAIHASYIFDNAEFFDSITEATKDCALAAGTTRRRGQNRKGKLYLPEEFAQMADRITGSGGNADDSVRNENFSDSGKNIENSENGIFSFGKNIETSENGIFSFEKDIEASDENIVDSGKSVSSSEKNDSVSGGDSFGQKIAVVFGNERTGLTDEELEECTEGVTIPASESFGSLNLSHAVQIISYHLFRKKNSHLTGYTPLTLERIDKTVGVISENLKKIGFFKLAGQSDMEHFWRNLLSRSAISESEAKYIEKIFTKAAGLSSKRNAE